MNTFAYSRFPCQDSQPAGHARLPRLVKRFGPMAGVVALHAIVLFAVTSGMATRVIQQAIPAEIFVDIVTPPPPKAAAAPAPKMVELAPPPMLTPPPVIPEVQVAQAAPAPLPVAVTVAAAPVEKPTAPVAVAAPPAPVPVAGPKTLSSGVEYIQPPQPVYPSMSKRMGEQGKVILLVLINEKGVADKVTVQSSSGFQRLDEAGRQAALRAVFKPHVEDGRAVPVYVVVPLNFSLAS